VRGLRAEEGQDRIAHKARDGALVAFDKRREVLERLFIMSVHSSGSSCSAMAVEPMTSQKSAVTMRRSPARPARAGRPAGCDIGDISV